MKIKISILTIYFVLSGCAFKSTTVSNDTKLPSMSARYDWKRTNGKDQYFKAERGLVQVSQNGVRSVSAVTLPIEIPNPLTISSDVLPDVKSRFNFSKAYIQLQDINLELPVKVTFDDNRVTFYVSGLASVVDSKVSSRFNLAVELFDGNSKIFTYSFELRTPPSKVQFGIDSDVNGSKEGTKISQSFKRIELNDKVYTLVKTLELKNEEDQQLEITFSETPKANLFQEVVSYIYEDIGCDAGGYRYYSRAWNDTVTEGVIVLPLDEKTLPTLLNADGAKQTQVIVLSPNSFKTFGVYSISQKVKDRLSDQSLKSTVSGRGVLTDCYKVNDYCEPSEHCHGRAGCKENAIFKTESENSVNYCTKKWERHSGSLGIGDQRLGLFVQFDEGQNLGVYRFNDHDVAKDAETRSVPLFQNKERVSWNP